MKIDSIQLKSYIFGLQYPQGPVQIYHWQHFQLSIVKCPILQPSRQKLSSDYIDEDIHPFDGDLLQVRTTKLLRSKAFAFTLRFLLGRIEVSHGESGLSNL